MRIFKNITEYLPIPNVAVTIGTFDGVHLGHRHILEVLKKKAEEVRGESLLVTFWPHPRMVVTNNPDEVRLLNSLNEKIELFEQSGLDNLLIIPFTRELSMMNPDDFIKDILIDRIKAKEIIFGYDHRFGHNRSGNFDFLKQFSDKLNFNVTQVPAVEIEGVSVSSTKIRKALETGNVVLANNYLGYEYAVAGIVLQGIGLGKKIGYPTANIQITDNQKLVPADGVYVVKVKTAEALFYGMLNIGINPTIEGKGRSIEVNIFDFSKDIYHQNITVNFLARLRDEQKFAGLEQLKAQLAEDERISRSYIKQNILG